MEVEKIFELILHAGNSRTSALMAMEALKEGDQQEVEKKMEEAESELHLAHQVQTDMIYQEANGEHCEMNILSVHAQDHLAMAMVTNDLIRELINMYKMILSLRLDS